MAPRVGIFGLSGCWGEQIVILNCEDQLLDILGAVQIVDFIGGSSRSDQESPLDIAFVEGSVGCTRDEEALGRIRARASMVVACGTCACFGGVAAIEPEGIRSAVIEKVFGSQGASYDIQLHRPLHDVVKVEFGIPGCPMEKDDFLRVLSSLLNGDMPLLPQYPVCMECKMSEVDCLLLSRGVPCAGPVTTAGCRARCPSYGVPCIGCRGPVCEANHASLLEILAKKEVSRPEARRKLRTFAPGVLVSAAPEVAR